MLAACKLALGPVLLAQGRWLRRTALRLPEPPGPRSGTTGGAGEPLGVLFLGDSAAAGVGVDHQSEALAWPAARLIAERLGRPVRWQLLARSGLNTAEALAYLERAEVQPSQVLVTSLGVNDVTSQQSPRAFARAYRALVDTAADRAGVRVAVVTGLPPMRILPAAPQPLRWYLGRCAERLDRQLRRLCEERERMVHLSLEWAAKPEEMARDLYHPGKGQYAHWAKLVAEHVEALLVGERAAAPG